jgi:hypothetical protein
MDFEQLGAFYLGKEFDLSQNKLLDRLLMYDSRDLTTHAVCVGMTGSGKTGLCIDLLEEAAIDRIPAIIIDPKGDITNLLLTFPDLQPQDFQPWINSDDALRKNLTDEVYAGQQADLWRKGLEQWGQSGARIKMLRDTADFAIYTPGSDAGLPVSILQSFAAPKLSWDDDTELLRERVQGTVSALLGLIGVDADPVRSQEHILLSNLFEYFWRQGTDLDLPKLILSIQNPPFRQLGVFDLEAVFPQKDRFGLAMALNNILAAPGFQSWLQGEPLDIPRFLTSTNGKPRHSIFYIAHLSDAERMFFVTMLLSQLLTWMRTQPGTTSLRALLYMDEIFGFFPPVENPPSKQPMLTLLKQARAFGLGIVLTTQNPVDLDYKGLTNTGTWLIGRLQTERDKDRVLDGLEGASTTAGKSLDRGQISQIISGLTNRVFLMHNVHEDAPVIFQTRWSLSYLRGPLTKSQIRTLSSTFKTTAAAAGATSSVAMGVASASAPIPAPASGPGILQKSPPSLASDFQQTFLPAQKTVQACTLELESRESGPVQVTSSNLTYVPSILALGRVHFIDRKLNIAEQQDYVLLADQPEMASLVDWERAQSLTITPRQLQANPQADATFGELSNSINEAKEFLGLKKGLVDFLYRTSSLTLFYSPALKQYSTPKESQQEFILRLQQSAREERDSEVDKIHATYETRLTRLNNQVQTAQDRLARKKADADAKQRETMVSIGESVLGMFMGRRSMRAASSALSKHRQASDAKMDMEQVGESVESLQKDIQALQQELAAKTAEVQTRWDQTVSQVSKVNIPPRTTDIDVDLFALAWAPYWQISYQSSGGLMRSATLPAF